MGLGPALRPRRGSPLYLIGIVLLLVVFGQIAVLTASVVTSHDSGGSLLSVFLRQADAALVGVPVMFLLSRIPTRLFRRTATPFLLGACFLQLLVVATPLGRESGGNTNWLKLGPLPVFQPSELLKLALVLWLGVFFARRGHLVSRWRSFLLPLLLVFGTVALLVLAGGDLGTTMILGMIVIGTLFLGQVSLRQIMAVLLAGAGAAMLAALTSASRWARILATLHPDQAASGANYQVLNGKWALATGGIFGIGLGDSRAKWGWLPSADADFIYAVIGEQTGLVGAVIVILLFLALLLLLLRGYAHTTQPAGRITIAGITVWIIGEAFVNLGVALGVVPALGVPLPFFSVGGTSLVCSLAGIGVVLAYLREGQRDEGRILTRRGGA